jgi:hypothetical protein
VLAADISAERQAQHSQHPPVSGNWDCAAYFKRRSRESVFIVRKDDDKRSVGDINFC